MSNRFRALPGFSGWKPNCPVVRCIEAQGGQFRKACPNTLFPAR